MLWAALRGTGTLLTDVLPTGWTFDTAVVRWFVAIRTTSLTVAATLAGELGSTAGIVLVHLVVVPLSLALTRRWRPPLFLLVAVIGETALFLATATVVERTRPSVEHLWSALPPTSSFPSGHVAAAVVTYGAIALLARAWMRGWSSRVFSAWAVAAPLAVALSRMYRGVHYPTDTIASVLYAVAWLLVCWGVLRPVPPRTHAAPDDAHGSDSDGAVVGMRPDEAQPDAGEDGTTASTQTMRVCEQSRASQRSWSPTRRAR